MSDPGDVPVLDVEAVKRLDCAVRCAFDEHWLWTKHSPFALTKAALDIHATTLLQIECHEGASAGQRDLPRLTNWLWCVLTRFPELDADPPEDCSPIPMGAYEDVRQAMPELQAFSDASSLLTHAQQGRLVARRTAPSTVALDFATDADRERRIRSLHAEAHATTGYAVAPAYQEAERECREVAEEHAFLADLRIEDGGPIANMPPEFLDAVVQMARATFPGTADLRCALDQLGMAFEDVQQVIAHLLARAIVRWELYRAAVETGRIGECVSPVCVLRKDELVRCITRGAGVDEDVTGRVLSLFSPPAKRLKQPVVQPLPRAGTDHVWFSPALVRASFFHRTVPLLLPGEGPAQAAREAFNAEVADVLRGLGWDVAHSVKLGSDGDADVLAYDADRCEALVVQCKDLLPAYHPSSLSNRDKEIAGAIAQAKAAAGALRHRWVDAVRGIECLRDHAHTPPHTISMLAVTRDSIGSFAVDDSEVPVVTVGQVTEWLADKRGSARVAGLMEWAKTGAGCPIDDFEFAVRSVEAGGITLEFPVPLARRTEASW